MSDNAERPPASGSQATSSSESEAGSALVSLPKLGQQNGPRASNPPSQLPFAPLLELAREAIQAEERTQKQRAELEQQAYLEALKYDDLADQRATDLEKARIQGRQELASRRLSLVGAIVLAGLIGIFALGWVGHVREALELTGAVVIGGMGYLTGREQGRRQEREQTTTAERRDSQPPRSSERPG